MEDQVMKDPVMIQLGDIQVIKHFLDKTYSARESCLVMDKVLDKCKKLFELDNKCMVVSNDRRELCNSYPNRLIIPESEREPERLGLVCTLPRTSPTGLGSTSFIPGESAASFSLAFGGAHASGFVNQHLTKLPSVGNGSLPGDWNKTMEETPEVQSNGKKLRDLILEAKLARRETSFPVPVILYNGKYICRSAALSGYPEIHKRAGSNTADDDDDDDDDEAACPPTKRRKKNYASNWQLFDLVRSQDITLLKTYNVGMIVDLVAEKKVKESSEKVDKEDRYGEFRILSLPYPGCEFFTDVRNPDYNAKNVFINWNQPYIHAHLDIPETLSAKVTSDWNKYQEWDLMTLSKNYLRLLLTCAQDESKGILVHCVSGWDRTPLFISLLRLSLWADGLIHTSLDNNKILYLTIAYDWMAFGHDLRDWLYNRDVFFFCFYFLKYITSNDFSLVIDSVAGSDDGLCGQNRRESPRASTSPMDTSVSHSQQAPRTRKESVSSTESVMVISETGSPHGSTDSNCNLGLAKSLAEECDRVKSDLLDSAHTIKEEESFESDIEVFNRTERLHQVQDAFYKLYATF